MKKLLMVLLAKFVKSHAKEVAKANKWLDSAQAQFATAIEEANIAEAEVDVLIERKEVQVKAMLEEIDELFELKGQANTFKSKLQDFLNN